MTVEKMHFSASVRARQLVFHNFNSRLRADDDISIFKQTRFSNIETNRSEKLECAASGSRLGATEHHANLFADLINENQNSMGLIGDACEFTHRLGHQTRLEAHLRITHITL